MKWQNPPDKSKRSSKWSKVFDELRENPGRWANIYEGRTRSAHSLAGRLRVEYKDNFSIISRTTGEDSAGVWAQCTDEVEDESYTETEYL